MINDKKIMVAINSSKTVHLPFRKDLELNNCQRMFPYGNYCQDKYGLQTKCIFLRNIYSILLGEKIHDTNGPKINKVP